MEDPADEISREWELEVRDVCLEGIVSNEGSWQLGES